MAIISYKIKNDRITLFDNSKPHPMDVSYKQANQAWAALRKYYSSTNDQLRKAGWRVKMDVDETELAIEAAEVAVDHAPMPGILRQILGALFGKKG